MSQKLSTFQRVRTLNLWQGVAFSATLLTRMTPNYQLFCEVTEHDGVEQYRKTLSTIWTWLGSSKSKVNFAAQLEKIESQTPDASEHDSFGVYPAIDAAISMASTINLIKGDDEGGAVVVSKLSQGTVEAFIEATSEHELSKQEIKAHPLMEWEIAFQSALLDMIEGQAIDGNLIKQLQAMAVEEGMSNIGLEINQ